MTRIRFGPFVVAVLLSLSARAAASETAPPQTRIDLVGVPRGLADIGSAACDDARSFCRTAVLRALGEDEKLTRFLDNLRETARQASTPGSADGYAVAVPDPSSLKLPELLALGCCLSAGDCADEVTSSLPPDADADARIDASISTAAAAAEILALAASHPDAARAPAATMMLAADAAACSPPGNARRCDDSIVDAFRRAGRAGANEGAMRAAEVLIARYAGGLVERGSSCEGGDGGDPADAAVARALLKGLLATTLDGAAASRLKDLQRVEEMRVANLGEHDAAYRVADALVNLAAKVFLVFLVFFALVAAPLRLSSSLRERAWRWSGCAAFARQFRREMEWLGVVEHRRVNGGRQARRFEGHKVTKKFARRVVKEARRGRVLGAEDE